MALTTQTALKAQKVDNSAHLRALGLSAPVAISCPGLSPSPVSRGLPRSHLYRYAPLVAVGLDAAGKTTILYKLKLGEIVTTIPTIGESGGKIGRRRRAAADLLRICSPFCISVLGADTRYSYLRSGSQYLYMLDGAQESWM